MAAIKVLETLSLKRVRGGRILTTLFHITTSWPEQRRGRVRWKRESRGSI
jgi:hypothetical protein